MRYSISLIVLLFCLLATANTVTAAKVGVYLGGGISVPVSSSDVDLSLGGHGGAGLGISLSPMMRLRPNVQFISYSGQDRVGQGFSSVVGGAELMCYTAQASKRASGYFIIGMDMGWKFNCARGVEDGAVLAPAFGMGFETGRMSDAGIYMECRLLFVGTVVAMPTVTLGLRLG